MIAALRRSASQLLGGVCRRADAIPCSKIGAPRYGAARHQRRTARVPGRRARRAVCALGRPPPRSACDNQPFAAREQSFGCL